MNLRAKRRLTSLAIGLVIGLAVPGSAAAVGWALYYGPNGSLGPNTEVVMYVGNYRGNYMLCHAPAFSARIRYVTTGGSTIRSVSSTSCFQLSTGLHATESSVSPRCHNRTSYWKVVDCEYAYP